MGSTVHRVAELTDAGSSYRVEAGATVALVRGTTFGQRVEPDGDITVALERCGTAPASILIPNACLEFPGPGDLLSTGQKRTTTARGVTATENFTIGAPLFNVIAEPVGGVSSLGTENAGLATGSRGAPQQESLQPVDRDRRSFATATQTLTPGPPSPTPTRTSTSAATATSSPTVSASVTVSPTATTTSTPFSTPTPSFTATATSAPTATFSMTLAPTPTRFSPVSLSSGVAARPAGQIGETFYTIQVALSYGSGQMYFPGPSPGSTSLLTTPAVVVNNRGRQTSARLTSCPGNRETFVSHSCPQIVTELELACVSRLLHPTQLSSLGPL